MIGPSFGAEGNFRLLGFLNQMRCAVGGLVAGVRVFL